MATINCNKATYSVNVPEVKIDCFDGGFYMISHRHCAVEYNTEIFYCRRGQDNTVPDGNGDVFDKNAVVS